jgi:hypothetical protein
MLEPYRTVDSGMGVWHLPPSPSLHFLEKINIEDKKGNIPIIINKH